ncbi:tape measure protein [Mixta calida]|uniref:tape measure protein n=1 Tax=Mixta calida TaxID=665913 RepID=UPI0029133AC5|nr:tape measure protein [Mixta calida]MDU4290355.1 tape measure protein [Mixta calida]
MSQVTIDEFIIQLSMTETVTKSLQKLERQIMPVATRIEKTLNRAFSRDHSRAMNKTFTNIEKRSQQAANQINRNLSQAFNVHARSGLFRDYENQGRAATSRVREMIRNAYRIDPRLVSPLPLPVPRGANARQRINDLADRQRTSGFYGNLQLRDQAAAQRYNSRLQILQMQHTASGDLAGFRTSLRHLNYEFSQLSRAASQQRAQQRLNAISQRNMVSGIDSLSTPLTGLVGGFFALSKAMQFFQDSIEEGAKRQQAATMATVAYGSQAEATRMTLKADEVSNNYGLDTVTTRQQMAQMRMTMPKSFSNDQIAKLFENESVFAHTTGMNADAVGRLNYAMQQIAASPKLNGQDWLQVVNAAPALVNKMVAAFNVKDAKALKDKMKTMAGSDIVTVMLKALEPTPEQVKMAQHNILAAQGRLSNSQKGAMEHFFKGFEKPLSRFYDTLGESINNSGGLIERGGVAVGWFIDRLTDIVETLDTVSMNIDGYLGLFEEKWETLFNKLSPDTQKALKGLGDIFNEWFDWLLALVAVKFAVGGASKLGRIAGITRAGSAAAESAAVAGAGGSTVMSAAGRTFGAAAAIVMGVELGNLVFDQWIPEFQKFAHKQWGWGGKDGTETTHGGNVIKDSPIDKALNWLRQEGSEISKNWNQTKNAPLLPQFSSPTAAYLQKPIQVNVHVPDSKVEFGPVELKMPDGSIQRIALDIIQQQHEVQMMSAQGLQGGWQSPGQNAGFTPSSLMRSN